MSSGDGNVVPGLDLVMTHTARKLHITFTVRGTRVRVISARDMHRKERTIYEEAP